MLTVLSHRVTAVSLNQLSLTPADQSWVNVLCSLRAICFAFVFIWVHLYELLRICHISFCSQDMQQFQLRLISSRVSSLLSAWPLVSAQWRNSSPKNEMLPLTLLLFLISFHVCMLLFYGKTQKGKQFILFKNKIIKKSITTIHAIVCNILIVL